VTCDGTPAASRAAGVRRAIAAFIVTLAMACVAGCGNDDGPTNGPLEGIDVSEAGIPQTAGKPFVFGLPIVVNTGKQPVVFERIDVERMPDGLELLETYVIGPERKAAIVFELDWPSKTGRYDGTKPVRGYELAPRTQGRARCTGWGCN
jgi:hypothetical protein